MLLVLPTFAETTEENVEEILLIATKGEQAIQVQLNGEMIDFTDENGQKVEPKIMNDRTMVPMRKIFEVLGAEVSWNGEEKIITANTENSQIILQIDHEKAVVKPTSGEEVEIVLDAVPVIYEDRTLVPVRFIAESLNKKVDWDAENKTVIIVDEDWMANYIKENAPTLYQLLSEEREEITSYASAGEISGKLKYTDKDSRTNTSTLNMKGTFSCVISGEYLNFKCDANITGKGALKDAIKKAGLEKISANMIIDTKAQEIYLKGNLMDELNEGGWVKLSMTGNSLFAFAEFLSKDNTSANSLERVKKAVNQTASNKDSYANSKMILDLICYLFREDTLKVTTKGTTNTYTWSIGVIDLLKAAQLEEKEIQDIENVLSGSVEVKTSFKDGIEKETDMSLSCEYLQEREQLALEMTMKNEVKGVNENVTIILPEESEVVAY